MSVQVRLNDYLDIYCPHYPEEEEEDFPRGPQEPEVLALYLVAEKDFRGCVESKRAIKRWECNSPHAPFGPVRFSEKIQRFTPFSLGFEFIPGHHYYYSSLPTDEGPPLPCMKLRVTVCCEPSSGFRGASVASGAFCVWSVHIDVGASRTHTHEGQGSDGEERSVRYDVIEPRSSTAHLPSPRLFCTATRSYAQRSYA
ncbi:unnamed protein product [Arctogadus glacialis]